MDEVVRVGQLYGGEDYSKNHQDLSALILADDRTDVEMYADVKW
jgi:hypothetical protein